MTETTSKIRALFLTGLMVASVFAMTMAFSGSAVAAPSDRGAGAEAWETDTGSGNIGYGATVFQGEDDITFTGDSSLTDFERSSGSDEGIPLSDPIDEDQTLGSYDDGTDSISVQEPQITDHEFRLGGPEGADVAGGSVPADENDLTVWAEYSFASAEDLDVVVEDSDGTDVTGEVISDATQSGLDTGSADDVVEFDLNLENLDDGEQYTVTLEGTDDLDSDAASVSDTFSISTDDGLSLSLSSSEVTQGESITYDAEGGVEGEYHVVRINENDVRDDASASDVFRNIEDTVSTDVDADAGFAYAVVEVDGGVATGGVRTAPLSDTDVDVEVTQAVGETYDSSVNTSVNDLEEEDTATLSVNEGEVSLESPSGFYVPGAETMVNGTADEGIDEVSFWARAQGNYERVEIDGSDTVNVAGEEFEAEDVQLSDGAYGGNDILSLPGTYRFAVVAGDPASDNAMTTSQVSRNISDTISLRVTESDLEANASIINGMVAEGDNIDISGVSQGSQEISVSFYGPRGSYDRIGGINVDSDGTFEEEDLSIGGHLSVNEQPVDISQGTVVMSVFSAGRDGVPGDGSHGSEEFASLWSDINTGSFTQQQAIERLSSETTEDTGSDDMSVAFQFRYTDARTTVEDVVGEEGVSGAAQIGNEIEVGGTTNRQPDTQSITVEVIDGPSASEFPVGTTEEWGTDGTWNVSMNTTGLEPGNYTVEASDGDSSDVMSFSLSEDAVSTDTPTETDDTTPTETDTDDTTPTETDMDDTTPDETETDGEDGPGFGVAIALIALIAAALLAVRRSD